MIWITNAVCQASYETTLHGMVNKVRESISKVDADFMNKAQGDNVPVFMNLVTLMDTKCGGGIEAWVNLDEQDMENLQGNQELLAYASLDPSPI
ncbi:vinorine synthase-like protein [Tanacetum coccineum]